MRKLATISLLFPLLIVSGCSSLPKAEGLSMRWPWKREKQPKPYPNPVKMAVTWTPDVLVQPGRTPTRGLGGRVFFYNEKSQSVPVEGDLIVHGFDESAADQGDPASGVKRFRFTSEQFKQHFSETDLGASYSVWIPWDAAGGEQKKLSLMPSFKTATGRVVQGEAAKVVLPGKKAIAIAEATPGPKDVRQVGHFIGSRAQHQGLTTTSEMQTTTIPLPGSLRQRLARLPEQSRPKLFTKRRREESNKPSADATQ